MEQFPNPTKLPEQIEAQLQQKISFAKEHALTHEAEQEISEKKFEMEAISSQRELTDEEVELFYSFREKMNDATTRVETLPEARRVMEVLGFNEADLIDTLAHENAHGNKAEQLGANHHGYSFTLSETADGKFAVQPQAITSIPDEWSTKKANEVDAQILQAPDEYGNKMSDSDKKKLEEIYRQ